MPNESHPPVSCADDQITLEVVIFTAFPENVIAFPVIVPFEKSSIDVTFLLSATPKFPAVLFPIEII